MSRRVISFFVHDLGANPIVRAAPLARALQDGYDVEMIGFLFDGAEVYAPYRDLFPYKTVPITRSVFDVAAAMSSLACQATGDVIYACKPLVTSLGPALLAARKLRAPVILDVEDDEWIPFGSTWPEFFWKDIIKGWRHATAWKYTRALHPFTQFARAVTVSSRRLQQRYGGTLVRHGPDERAFDPARADLSRAACRQAFGLPPLAPLALFAGTPQPHKGWETLIRALQLPNGHDWHLVTAGQPDHPDMRFAAERLGIRCHHLGPQPQERMPALLAAVDAVPVPQRQMLFAQSQIPAKMLEAMAMGVAVAATRVGDLPEILGDGSRGWLFEPDDPAGLADALGEIAGNREEVTKRGRAARQWFMDEASRRTIRDRVGHIVERVLQGDV